MYSLYCKAQQSTERNVSFKNSHRNHTNEIFHKTSSARGGDSLMKQTGMLVGNFEFNP